MKVLLTVLLALVMVTGNAIAAPPIRAIDAESAPATLPSFKKQPKAPRYPSALGREGIGGSIVLRLDIDQTGKVKQVLVLEPSGQKQLDDASIAAAKTWLFSPALDAHGKPTPASVKVPLTFFAGR